MVQLAQFVLSILSLPGWSRVSIPHFTTDQSVQPGPSSALSASPGDARKSIAIVGAGSGGLAVLKTLLDLPEDVRSSWDIALYDQRRDVGGLWLPDPVPPHPPVLPETPLYPRLRTNTPHPTMTYPGFTFPPGTPLFPTHDFVQQYHADFAEKYNLTGYIHLNHTILAAGWNGTHEDGRWILDIGRTNVPPVAGQIPLRRSVDHLIVANGHNHYPRIPHWPGEQEWLASTPEGAPKREILHSIFYRKPEKYVNRTVVIVGGGASGRDAALQVGPLTTVYQSLREGSAPPDGAQVIPKPPISHFTSSSVVFTDGSSLNSVDAFILATGYEFRVPFLSRIPRNSGIQTPALITDANTLDNSTTANTLTSNLRYIFPLYEHIFSLSTDYPPTALAFVGLPVLIANCPSDRAQSLFVSHAIADPSVLPSRAQMLSGTLEREDKLRQLGLDPYVVGHKMQGGDSEAQLYQNNLVHYLKKAGKLPDDGVDYVEPWRKMARNESQLLARAWVRVEGLGEQQKWLEGVETEEEWADLMYRLADWEGQWEQEHGETPYTYL